MRSYANLSGNSGVVEYRIGRDFIALRFRGEPQIYIYGYRKPGRAKVEQMKRLAVAGSGLSSFVSRQVRDQYERKLEPSDARE